ncbi:MAG: hypothetical protein ACYC1C_19250 [Chloroflexota bacterium]
MNYHSLLDIISVTSTSIAVGRHKFFADSVDSPGYVAHLEAVALDVPAILGEGHYEVGADTLVGRLDPAFEIVQWLGHAYPTIIYHHGNNERPFDYGRSSKNTFKHILFSHREQIQANLIALRAPFHRDLRENMRKMGDLANFVAMLVVSTKLIQGLVDYARAQGSARVLVAGISLGGWVTNLHRTFYNSADVYVPLLAGTALGDMFVDSIYRRVTGRPAKENPAAVRRTLNFEDDFAKVLEDNAFPLLARYDQIIRLDRQRASYGKHPVAVIDRGHITAALASDLTRAHILAHLEFAFP